MDLDNTNWEDLYLLMFAQMQKPNTLHCNEMMADNFVAHRNSMVAKDYRKRLTSHLIYY